MSTEYKIVEHDGCELVVQTRSDGLDLRVSVKASEYPILLTNVIEPRALAVLGLKIVSAAMYNDYSGEGCTIDPPAFKSWLLEQINDL